MFYLNSRSHQARHDTFKTMKKIQSKSLKITFSKILTVRKAQNKGAYNRTYSSATPVQNRLPMFGAEVSLFKVAELSTNWYDYTIPKSKTILKS